MTTIQVNNNTDQTITIVATDSLGNQTSSGLVLANACINLLLNGAVNLTACSQFGLCSSATNVSNFACVGVSYNASGLLSVSPLAGCQPCVQPIPPPPPPPQPPQPRRCQQCCQQRSCCQCRQCRCQSRVKCVKQSCCECKQRKCCRQNERPKWFLC